MPSIQEFEQALIEADKAGDTEAATALAGDMERLMSAPEQPKPPGIMDVIAGKHTIGEFASGRMEDLKTIGKQIIDPKTWANLPDDLQKAFPMDPKTGKLTPKANKKLEDLAILRSRTIWQPRRRATRTKNLRGCPATHVFGSII